MEQGHSSKFVPSLGTLLEWRWVKKRPKRGGGGALVCLRGTPGGVVKRLFPVCYQANA
jgi:hypothetical protein